MAARDRRGRRSLLLALGPRCNRTKNNKAGADSDNDFSDDEDYDDDDGELVSGITYFGAALSSAAFDVSSPALPEHNSHATAFDLSSLSRAHRFARWIELPCTGLFSLQFTKRNNNYSSDTPAASISCFSGNNTQDNDKDGCVEIDFVPWLSSTPTASNTDTDSAVENVDAANTVTSELPLSPAPLPPLFRAYPHLPASPAAAVSTLPAALLPTARALITTQTNPKLNNTTGNTNNSADGTAVENATVGGAAATVFLSLLARSVARRVALQDPLQTQEEHIKGAASDAVCNFQPALPLLSDAGSRPTLIASSSPNTTASSVSSSQFSDVCSLRSDSQPQQLLAGSEFGQCGRVAAVDATAALRPARVAVAFSGGIDCSVVALLAHYALPAGEPIDLISVAFQGDVDADTVRGLSRRESRLVYHICRCF